MLNDYRYFLELLSKHSLLKRKNSVKAPFRSRCIATSIYLWYDHLIATVLVPLNTFTPELKKYIYMLSTLFKQDAVKDYYVYCVIWFDFIPSLSALKKRYYRIENYSWLPISRTLDRCSDSRWNTVSRVGYIFSIERKTKE